MKPEEAAATGIAPGTASMRAIRFRRRPAVGGMKWLATSLPGRCDGWTRTKRSESLKAFWSVSGDVIFFMGRSLVTFGGALVLWRRFGMR